MLRRLLRLFDPRIGIGILVVVVTILVFQFVVGGIASQRLAESERGLKASAAAVKNLEESVALLKDSGATNADQLKGRLEQVAALLPKKLDDVYVTTIFVNLADSSAVDLSKFEPKLDGNSTGGSSTVKILTIPGLEGSAYSFMASGTVPNVLLFIQGVLSSDKVFATINEASLNVSQGAEGTAIIEGIIVIWTDATAVVESANEDESTTVTTEDTSVEPSDVPDTVPSSEGPATTLPSGESTLPTTPPADASPITSPPTTDLAPTTTLP